MLKVKLIHLQYWKDLDKLSCTDMKLPEIINTERLSDGFRLQLFISPELEAFDGHFEKTPIVPGVVQILWVIEFARKYFHDLPMFNFNSIEKLKFQHVIQPEMNITLELQISDGNVFFTFSSTERKHSSGKIVISK